MKKLLLLGIVFCFFGATQFANATDDGQVAHALEAQIPPASRSCTSTQDCVLIEYGCSGVTVANKQHISETTNLAYRLGGNPAELKCSNVKRPIYMAGCNNNQCQTAPGE